MARLLVTGGAGFIGGNEERANIDIVNSICRELDNAFASDSILAQRFPNAPAAIGRQSSLLITSIKDRPGHDWRYAIDTERIKDELGFSPKYDFASGLQKTITWMLDQEPWWRAVMDGSYRDWVDTHYGSG